MPYSAEISRSNPTCFYFLVDQSGSMDDPMPTAEEAGQSEKKADVVARVLNRSLSELSLRCAREEGVRDYFHVGVLGYGHNVGSAFVGQLAGRDVVPISEVAAQPARIEERHRKIEDGAGGLVEQPVKFPVWLDPVAKGGTPMCQTLDQVRSTLTAWVAEHPTSFPPIVINLTDGESTDGDPTEAATLLRSLGTADGDVLVFNCHISSTPSTPISFPDSDVGLPDAFARLLFDMSSLLPQPMRSAAQQNGFAVTDGTRGFVFNADSAMIVQFLDIGTRASGLR